MAYSNFGSPSDSNLSIGIALVLKDRFSHPARDASSWIRQLEYEAKRAVDANANFALNMASAAKSVGDGILSGMKNMVSYGADYSKEMVYVTTISGATAKEVEKLDQLATSLGEKTMFSALDIASGMKYLAMAGNDATEITQLIKGSAELANATGMALAGKGGAADLLTNIMKTFRLEGEHMATIVGDKLGKAAASSNTSMADLAAAIKYAGADAVAVNQELSSIAAAIGVLGNAGIQGSMAGTALANMLRYLTKSIAGSSKKGKRALDQLGLGAEDFVDAQGNLKDLGHLLTVLKKATSGLSTLQRSNILWDIFGVRGNRAGQAFLNNLDDFYKILDKIDNQSSGFNAKVTEEIMKTPAGAINLLKSSWENFKIEFTQSVAPLLVPLLKGLSKVVKFFQLLAKTPIAKVTIVLTAISGAVLAIASRVAMLRLRFLLLTNDSTISFTNMFNVMFGGWSKNTEAVRAYYNQIVAVQALSKAGMIPPGWPPGGIKSVGNFGGVAAGNNKYYFATSSGALAYAALDKRGRPFYRIQGQRGFVSQADFNKATKNPSGWSPVPGKQGLKGMGPKLGNIGSKIGKGLGYLGIATMIWGLLDSVRYALKSDNSNKENLREISDNTAALRENTQALKAAKDSAILTEKEESMMIYNVVKQLLQTLEDKNFSPSFNFQVDSSGNVVATGGGDDSNFNQNVR